MTKIDFRSDTVTKPTAKMLEAMNSAQLGDDVFGDDPTVNSLESKAAALFGKQASLFCPSGTMTNQIAINVHTRPGDEVICDRLAHIYNYEGGGIAFNSGCSMKLMEGDRGRFSDEDVLAAVNPDDPHFPISKLVSIENTCNKGAGAIWDISEIESIQKVCQEKGLKFHLDGARLFNALVESDYNEMNIGSAFDSISICLSKGLGCPVGSLLIGDADFIKRARRIRKVFGGGMRQAGILAAAGIYALDNHVERLRDDHANARTLGEILNRCHWVESVMPTDTNILVVNIKESNEQERILNELESFGVLAVGFGPGKIRFVTHLDIDGRDIDSCGKTFNQIT
jgi:threonine aldolase